MGKRQQNRLRERWKEEDPTSFEAQEMRRAVYEDLKANGRVIPTLAVQPKEADGLSAGITITEKRPSEVWKKGGTRVE